MSRTSSSFRFSFYKHALLFVGGMLAIAWLCLLGGKEAKSANILPRLNIDLRETTVSGISSGAFMAVQMAVAHSSFIMGVASTAGGPYFCAGEASWGGAKVAEAIARCMQGDPSLPATPITEEHHALMRDATIRWAAEGKIDPVDALARQKVWIFHGYNDGIVKTPVSEAVQIYYNAFTPAYRIFYKHELPAAHAQISAACSAGKTDGVRCNACSATGGNFINACAADGVPYDAAGSALQFFYGPMQRIASEHLQGKVVPFSQARHTLRDGIEVAPARISMAEEGYLYVPRPCQEGERCRLHIAFHGCRQYAGKIGMDFVKGAGFNEWAEANRIVVLFPQAASSSFIPANPNGCWDWWGYNDTGDQEAGHYLTREGLQVAAVWRMAQALAGDATETGAGNTQPNERTISAAGAQDIPAASVVQALDVSSDQVLLAWNPVAGARAYVVYRQQPGPDGEPVFARVSPEGFSDTAYVDRGLGARQSYLYRIVALGVDGRESVLADSLTVRTAAREPACDPYFSMLRGLPVDKDNRPADTVCK
ncbi:MAG: hypothetical protein LBO79_05715 [Zoogloeaceae bacterium]|jgi:poly(3-hydroxybutyrate) depolymerase|nr:hypothetical protein [Zoogloeaceae bacterium]